MRVWRNHPRSKKTVPQNAMTAFLWGTSSRAGDVRWRHRCDLASHRILLHPIASPRCPDDRHPGPAAGREGLCAAPPNQASSQNVIFALARSKAKPSSHPKIRCPAFFLVLAALCHEASIRGHLSGGICQGASFRMPGPVFVPHLWRHDLAGAQSTKAIRHHTQPYAARRQRPLPALAP